MWCTVLVLALVATADPVRIGVGVLLASRPRAAGPLVAFWLGGIAVSVALGTGVLFGVRGSALSVMHRVEVATATPTAGHIQVGMGVFALLVAAVAVGLSPRQRAQLGMLSTADLQAPSMARSTVSRMSLRAQNALQARPLRVSFVLGVGMLVDFRFLAALASILASGAALGTQISAAGVYTLVALAFVELPLVSRLAAPARTDWVMAAVNRWAKARRQQVFAVVIALLGIFLMSRGMSHV